MNNSEIQNIKNKFGIVGADLALNRAIDVAVQVASTDLSVLITGESGVGKEKFPKLFIKTVRESTTSTSPSTAVPFQKERLTPSSSGM